MEPGVPLQDVTTEYKTEGTIRAVTALEDDTVFAVTVSPSGYQLSCFDGEGNCVDSFPLEGYANIDSIIAAEDEKIIYFAGQKANSIHLYLFALHTDTKQVDELCDFGMDIARARKIILLENKIYVMGQKKMRAGSFNNGPNGAGKSTLVNLLLGFYEPQNGKITYNGTEISAYNPNTYRKTYAMMFQDSRLYPFTLAQNLLLCNNPKPDDSKKLWEVLRLVGMENTVKELPLGLDTPLTKEFSPDGVVFSQGQQQRLLLARALLLKAQVFLMDEPTAAQDAQMESEMNALFRRLSENKTLLLISHRLSTISGMEYIYLLNAQGIEEEGTHEELMKLGGHYARIYTKQAELYQMD